MYRLENNESGFSLLELLSIVCIIWVLSGLAMQSYKLYQKRAYDSAADQMLNTIKVALESGRIEDSLTDPPEWRFVTINQPEQVNDPNVTEFLPGLVYQAHVELSVERNGECEMGQMGNHCITEWIEVRHCKGETVKAWWRFRDGTENRAEWQAIGFPPC